MDKFSALIVPTNISNFSGYQALYRHLHSKLFIIIGMPLTAFYAIYHLSRAHYTEGSLLVVMFISLCWFLYDFRSRIERSESDIFREITIRVFLIGFILCQLYDLWFDQSLSTTPWFLIFPLLAFFSMAIKEALVWLLCITSVFFYFLFVTDLNSNPDEIFLLKSRLLLIYGVLAIIAFSISAIVRTTMQKQFANAKELETINLKLEKQLEEQAQAEETLRRNEEKFRLLTENVNDVIYTMDMDLNYTYISPAVEKILGWSPSEAMSLQVEEILTPKSLELLLDRIAKHMVTGARNSDFNITDRLELEVNCKDGTTIMAEFIASFILDEAGKPEGILGVGRDITERKKLENQLQRAQRMEAIGTLAGGVAHDLNNILSAQVSYPDLILMDLPEDSPLKEPILTIQKSGKKAAAIVQDLLTLARRGVVATEVVNLNSIIGGYIKSPECENLLEFYTGIKVECDLEPDLLNVMGSSNHLSATIANMFSNAAEAMPGGGKIYISTQNKYIDKPLRGYEKVDEGDYVTLTISDSGAGISSEDIEKIFEPFYTKKVMGRSGTGLGLAVVWGTVKDHRGYIEVISTEETGTTFTLYFPATRNEVGRKEGPIPIESYIGKGETVLVVDDVEEQCQIASNILKKLHYAPTAVFSGEEAVNYMKNNSADLLVLDMIMNPGIDGLETYKRILELHPGQKAIIASGFSETEKVKEAQSLGAGQYIKKPYTLEKIGLAIKEEFEK